MSDKYIRNQYEQKTNIELLLIATNNDSSWTNEAVETAKSILSSRYNGISDLEKAWNYEIQHLSKLAEACSLCQNLEVAYIKEFYLCTPEELDAVRSIPGIALTAILGIGYTVRKRTRAVKLEFRLRSECLAKHTIVQFGKKKVLINYEEYYRHPLCSLYYPLGYTDLTLQS
jgi:hypothetical protein